MHLTVKLGNFDESNSSMLLDLPDTNPTVSEVINKIRQELSPWYVAVMERGIEGLEGEGGVESIAGGVESLPKKASLFLALQSNEGLKKLELNKRISDYHIEKHSVLWLMCSTSGLTTDK